MDSCRGPKAMRSWLCSSLFGLVNSAFFCNWTDLRANLFLGLNLCYTQIAYKLGLRTKEVLCKRVKRHKIMRKEARGQSKRDR